MKESSRTGARAGALAALGFDPDEILVRDPAVLLDPRFLGRLHLELGQDMAPDEVALTLLQVGFLHGLRDASRILARTLQPDAGGSEAAMTPPLAIRCRANPQPRQRGAIEIHGCWPERHEASARLSQLGPAEGCSCWLSAGYTSGWLSGTLGADIVALESSCCAAGDASCAFVAREAEVWRADGEERARTLVDALPFDALRQMVQIEASEQQEPAADRMDFEQPVVHIWGPVMVLPWSGPDEALLAVELIGRDRGAREVSVIVLDLTGVIVDEAFGAAGLEQLVANVESWGADTIFAGVSPISEPVVAGLENQPLMVAKDVQSAIAVAFRIADSQRRVV